MKKDRIIALALSLAMTLALAAVADLLTLVVYGVLIYCFYAAIPVQAKSTSGIFGVPKSAYAIAMIIRFAFMCCCTMCSSFSRSSLSRALPPAA